ncbi:MAG: hypothetical protein ABI273_17415 [Lacunisphaera sp.]
MNSSTKSSRSPRFALRDPFLKQRFGYVVRRVLPAVLVGIAVARAGAQQSATVNSGGGVVFPYSGPPAPVQPRPETYDNGRSLGPDGGRPYSHSTDIYPNEPNPYSTFGRRLPGPFFLPAVLPVLGTALSSNPRPLAAGYPREFAGETFFMAYGNLVSNNRLSAKRAELIARYRTARLSLLAELREQLSRVHDVSAEARQRDLAGLAANQTPRLRELEADAEKIRHDLTHVELFSTTADDIGDLPSNTEFEAAAFAGKVVPPVNGLGDLLPRHETPERNAALSSLRLILSAAYFRDGFSLEQRQLLEEMAIELTLVIGPGSDAGGPASVFFWPAGARIPIPVGLSPEAAAKFEEFQRRKATLKDELRAVLTRGENHIFNVDNTAAYAQLATTQAPRFAELDALADQIRPALAALADAVARSTDKLPADLAHQVAAIAERKAALQREMFTRLNEFRQALPAEHVELIHQNSGLAIAVTTGNGSGPTHEAILARITAFNGETSSRFKTLAADYDRVRIALARFQATAREVKPGVTVDQLAVDFLNAYTVRESRYRQRDYAAAVLASGLSPAQRRLLLSAADADLLEPALPVTQ